MHDCFFDSSLANHKLSYISKYISVTYALDSVHEKIDAWTEAHLLPILIDSYVELFMYLIATLGSVHEKFDVWTGPDWAINES